MGIGGGYVYTTEGIGEKALIHGLLLKSIVSLFSAFSGYNATIHPTRRIIFRPKRDKNGV